MCVLVSWEGCGVPSLPREVGEKFPVHMAAGVGSHHSVLLGQTFCIILFSPLFMDESVYNSSFLNEQPGKILSLVQLS